MSDRARRVPAFLGDGFVERGDAAAGLLELSAQRLEGGAVFLLQRREPLQHLRRERRARIGGDFLDQPVERIGDFLGFIDGGGDRFSARALVCSSRALLDDGARGPSTGR